MVILSNFAAPKLLVKDEWPKFSSTPPRSIFIKKGIEQIMMIPYHPQFTAKANSPKDL